MDRTLAFQVAAVVAAVTGCAVWEGARYFGARREAWDAEIYWSLGYPIMMLTAALIGFLVRRKAQVFAAVMLGSQALWALGVGLMTTGSAGLFPMGLLMFAALLIPCALAALLAQFMGVMILGEARS